jgi:hypothetical protein
MLVPRLTVPILNLRQIGFEVPFGLAAHKFPAQRGTQCDYELNLAFGEIAAT